MSLINFHICYINYITSIVFTKTERNHEFCLVIVTHRGAEWTNITRYRRFYMPDLPRNNILYFVHCFVYAAPESEWPVSLSRVCSLMRLALSWKVYHVEHRHYYLDDYRVSF